MTKAPLPSGKVQHNDVALTEASPASDGLIDDPLTSGEVQNNDIALTEAHFPSSEVQHNDVALTKAPLPSGEVEHNEVALSEASPPGKQDIQQTLTPTGVEEFVQNIISNVVKNLEFLAKHKEQKGFFFFFMEHMLCFADPH